MLTRRNFLKRLPFFGVLPLVYDIPCKAVVERPKRSLIGQLTLNLEQEFGEVAEANSAWMPKSYGPALYEYGEDGRHFPELGCWPPGNGVFPQFKHKSDATYRLFSTIQGFINTCLISHEMDVESQKLCLDLAYEARNWRETLRFDME